MKLQKGSKSHNILRALLLAGGLIVLSSVASVGGPDIIRQMIKGYFRKRRFQRALFLRDLKRLQYRELADYRELLNGDIKLVLTTKGKKKTIEANIDDVQIKKPKRWDGRWRMVTFDIPHSHKKGRDAVRRVLHRMGCHSIQKSVFITPYECGNEIDFICAVFEIPRRHVLLFTISDFEGEEKLRHHFNLI